MTSVLECKIEQTFVRIISSYRDPLVECAGAIFIDVANTSFLLPHNLGAHDKSRVVRVE
jgi:hypothetical protein